MLDALDDFVNNSEFQGPGENMSLALKKDVENIVCIDITLNNNIIIYLY